MTFQRS